MKKRVLLSTAALGLLFLGAATWPQDPESVSPQAAPPIFRDVLRGKIGQECSANTNDRVHWTLSFGPRHDGDKLVAVGQDFVQIRYEDGRERYVPLGRVDLLINTR